MGRASRLGAAIFLAGIALPLVQTFTRALHEPVLAGVEEDAAPPRPGARTWWDGSFQRDFEAWFTKRLGLRPWLVLTDNQIALTLFGELRTGRTAVAVGRENWLFEASYVKRYQRGQPADPEELRRQVAQLGRLRDLLAERGTALVVVVAPSKAEVYPDYLGPELARPGRAARGTAYDRMEPLLAGAGLDLVDAHRMFLERRASGDRTGLFTRGGTHWNHFGAALVVERILELLERRRPGELVTVRVAGSRVDRRVWTADVDLASLLNVWCNRPYRGPQTHPVLERREEGRRPARLLFVGDSFSLTLLNLMAGEGLMAPGDDLYYFKRRISYPGQVSSPLAEGAFDAGAELAGLDAVVLVTNEYFLPGVGFGFVPAAIAGLEGAAGGP